MVMDKTDWLLVNIWCNLEKDVRENMWVCWSPVMDSLNKRK